MILAAALLLALSVWLIIPPARRPVPIRPIAAPRSRRVPMPWVACGCAAAAAVAVLPAPLGALVGVAVLAFGPPALARLPSRAERRRRDDLMRQAPQVADLLAALAAGGASPVAALEAVSEAVGEPFTGAVARTIDLLRLGAPAHQAWASLQDERALRAVGEACLRSATTGAPLARVLHGCAADLRRRHLQAVQVAARSAGVQGVVPLAACFLPAFVLLGIVPVVASLAVNLLGN